MKYHLGLVLRASILGLVGLCPIACVAQVDPWEFEVYPYATAPRGMAEIETTNSVVTAGHTEGGQGTARGDFPSQGIWYDSVEFSYGLTDRIETAAYLNWAKPSGRGLEWAGGKVRFRGRLFDQGTLPIDVGWYAELEWNRTPQFDDASQELELRPILTKDFGPITVMLNPKFEKVLAGAGHNQGFEFGYAAGVLYRWKRRLSPGLEFYGGIGLVRQPDPSSEQQHYIFPTIRGELPGGIEYNAGVGYGLTRGSDRVIFKLNLELERFIGAIFKPSPDRAWFH